jgi:hypothetical protein
MGSDEDVQQRESDVLKMKKNFALRIDSEVYDAIEKWAADEFRSANGQIEWIIAEALKKAKRMPKKKEE